MTNKKRNLNLVFFAMLVFILGYALNSNDIRNSSRRVNSITDAEERTYVATIVSKRLADISEIDHDGIWTYVPHEKKMLTDYQYYSSSFRKMLGYSKEEFPDLVGSWVSIVNPEDMKKTSILWKRHIDSKGTTDYSTVNRYKKKDGTVAWINHRGWAIFDRHGVFVQGVGYHINLTDQYPKTIADW